MWLNRNIDQQRHRKLIKAAVFEYSIAGADTSDPIGYAPFRAIEKILEPKGHKTPPAIDKNVRT